MPDRSSTGTSAPNIQSLDAITAMIGSEIGLSDWLTISQTMIDQFAKATGDHQFIHIDPERAAQTPFGGTIAHGFLTLSLMPVLAEGANLPLPPGVKMGVNYGGNSVRFTRPVRSGSRVRGRFRLTAFEAKRPGQYQQTFEYRLEVEGEEKPAVIAEWITQIFAD